MRYLTLMAFVLACDSTAQTIREQATDLMLTVYRRIDVEQACEKDPEGNVIGLREGPLPGRS